MLMYHAELYVEYITSSLEMICKFCFTDDGLLVSFERFNVNLLNLMKDILKNTEYKPPTLKANGKHYLSFDFSFWSWLDEIAIRLI